MSPYFETITLSTIICYLVWTVTRVHQLPWLSSPHLSVIAILRFQEAKAGELVYRTRYSWYVLHCIVSNFSFFCLSDTRYKKTAWLPTCCSFRQFTCGKTKCVSVLFVSLFVSRVIKNVDLVGNCIHTSLLESALRNHSNGHTISEFSLI